MKIFRFLAAFAVYVLLIGCSDKDSSSSFSSSEAFSADPRFTANWEAYEMNFGDSSEDNYLGIPLRAMFQFVVNDDGTAEWHSPVEEQNGAESEIMTWRQVEKDEIQLVPGENSTEEIMTFEYRDGELVLVEDDVEIAFEKMDSFTEYTQDELKEMIENSDLSSITGQ